MEEHLAPLPMHKIMQAHKVNQVLLEVIQPVKTEQYSKPFPTSYEFWSNYSDLKRTISPKR